MSIIIIIYMYCSYVFYYEWNAQYCGRAGASACAVGDMNTRMKKEIFARGTRMHIVTTVVHTKY